MTGVPQARAGARAWLILGAAWTASVLLLAAWTLLTPAAVLRDQLRSYQFWSLEICVAFSIGTGIVVLREVAHALDWRDLVGMSVPGLVAAALLVGIVPRTNRIFYDEHIYQSVGQNLADLRLAQICNDGVVNDGRLQCRSAEYNKQPYAYPHLLSVAYRAIGIGASRARRLEPAAFFINAMAMIATVAAVYALVVILFADRVAAFFAALILALTPEQLVWSATAAVEPSASMTCVVALAAAAWFTRSRTTAALLGATILTAYAVQFRPESLLIVPVVVLLVWQRAREELARPRTWWAGLLFLGLVAIHIGHLMAVRNEGWGTTQARFALVYAVENLRVNGWFYLWDTRFPVVYTLFALVGLSVPRSKTGRITLFAYFFVFFAVTLLFYAGSYNYGADVRYSLSTYPPLAIAAGLGVASVTGSFRDRTLRRGAAATVALLIAGQFLGDAPVVRATTDGAWAARADVEFARSLVPELPDRSFVLTHNPSMFQLWGRSAGQMSFAADNPSYLNDLEARFPGGVYLHWNFWCSVQDPTQRDFCTKAIGLRQTQLIREFREQHYWFALYRLAPASR